MSNKGNNRHTKRLASAKYMKASKKVSKYIAKPKAGRHTLATSIALVTALKEKMGLASDSREAKMMMKSGYIKVNGKNISSLKYPIGFGDIIYIEPNNESYMVDVGKGGAVAIKKTKETERLLKVVGKFIAKGNKITLRLHDGSIVNGAKEIRVNDSVSVKDSKLEKHIKFEKGVKCYVIKGAHSSESGVIREIKQGTATRSPTVEVEGSNGSFETLLSNIMVTGA